MLRQSGNEICFGVFLVGALDRSEGSLKGERLALIDVATRRISPGRILSLD